MSATNNPFFSIIVPAYNVAEFLPQCIDSVLSQDFQDFELILVDDGSTDKTGEICDQYAKNPPQPFIISQNGKKVNKKSPQTTKIKVIHQKNTGLSSARNSGVKQASGQYLIFLDGDDYLEPNSLGNIAKNLQDQPDLLRYQAQDVDENGKIIPHPETGFSTMPGIRAFPRLVSYHYTENAWLYAYRREFFVGNNFQYAPGCTAEDFGLTPLIIASAQTVKSIPNICYDYRQRAGSIMHGATQISKRISDVAKQLQTNLPKIAKIPSTEPILHFLVVSFLTDAARLDYLDFLQFYQEAKRAGMFQYIHPSSLKSLPRSLTLKYSPKIFYHLYHH